MAKLEIEITSEQVEVLRKRAAGDGLSIEVWALNTLLNTPPPGSLAEALAPYVVPAQNGTDSAEASKKVSETFEDYLVQKKCEGHF